MNRGEYPRYRGTFLPPSNVPPDGSAFLLVKRDEGSFKNTNPFAVARTLDSICGGPVHNAKAIRSGALLVETRTKAQSSRLLNTDNFLGHSVKVELADRLNAVEGVISSDALAFSTDDELLHELKTQGVVGVYRLPSRDPEYPNPMVKVTFAARALPAALYCGYLAVEVRPWVASRARCTRCWTFGHSSRVCRRRSETCGRCGQGGHSKARCTSDTVSCPCCGEAHCAWDKACPYVRAERREHRQKQRDAADAHREEIYLRSRRSHNAASWPTLEETIPPTETSRRPRAQHRPTHSPSQAAARPTPSAHTNTNLIPESEPEQSSHAETPGSDATQSVPGSDADLGEESNTAVRQDQSRDPDRNTNSPVTETSPTEQNDLNHRNL